VLTQFTVDPGIQPLIGWIKLGFDPWPKWAEGVKSLRSRPLQIGELNIPGGYVISNGVTKDVVFDLSL
jgi:hypothetical protein